MADNCSVLDPWLYCKEPWMTEAFARDNAALTRALQISMSSSTSSSGAAATTITSPDSVSAATSPSPFLHHFATPTSEAAARHKNPLAAAPNGRVSKRKSRASKRTPTTYITADPENFREMVQRVTGVRINGDPVAPIQPVYRTEPNRATVTNRPVIEPPECLPTLDTSAFLLNQRIIAPVKTGPFEPVEPVDEPGFEFDTLLSNYPTLESYGIF